MGDLTPSSTDSLVRADQVAIDNVRSALETAGVNVVVEPNLRGLKPDLVIYPEDGPIYVVEIKSGTGPAHFGSLVQLSTYVDAVLQQAVGRQQGERGVMGIFVTTQKVPQLLKDYAETLGLNILELDPDSDVVQEVTETIIQ